MSEALLNSDEGKEFEIEGPFGKCVYRSSNGGEPIMLIGSGTGLAPLYGIVTDALHQGHVGPIHLYHGGRTSESLYFRRELAELVARHSNFSYMPCADEAVIDGDQLGSPLAVALKETPNLEGFKVYLCGHPALVKAAQRSCFLAGANLRDIAADPFVPA